MHQEELLRIGLIAPPWVSVPPVRYGGAEVAIDQLARELSHLGHEVVLFATKDSTCPVEIRSVIDAAPGVHVGGPAVEASHVLAAYASFEEFDLVHDHTTIGPLIGSERSSVPIVTTNHNRFIEPFTTIYRSMRRSAPIIAISEHHASTAAPLRLGAVIHHGIDVEGLPFGPSIGDYALFIGRMSPDKGVAEAIRIARLAGVPLLIGAKMVTDDEFSYFRSVIEPELGEDCAYVGEPDQAEKRRLLAGARCLLNPITWEEPFGIVMIESLACGTPVVVRRRGAAIEIVTDGATGFVRETDEELAEAVGKVGELSRVRCRSEVAGRFSSRRMAEQHVEVYRSVLAEAGRGPSELPTNQQGIHS